MPNKDGTGPKGQEPKDGKCKGKRTEPGQGPMTGGKNSWLSWKPTFLQ
ncbi:hypothetical protein MTBBW1_80052 [Desulfamplus magnetovallimortis]|uniref:Uncharacterized protein n=1 Tax=Desulfamplus magnetovallimortis TaxID=1246637 RepID=L0R3U4_9BACT|nr:hypothetical protein DEMABW1_80052 [Desulfamplus magnetovallimortis BW-1]SLM32714.1 hypothetical protein MTBBW1_80052 [Desulfamplus magnetovallimortis]